MGLLSKLTRKFLRDGKNCQVTQHEKVDIMVVWFSSSFLMAIGRLCSDSASEE